MAKKSQKSHKTNDLIRMSNTSAKSDIVYRSLHLIRGGLLCDFGINEVIEIGGQAFEREVGIFSEHVSCQIIILKLNVEQQ